MAWDGNYTGPQGAVAVAKRAFAESAQTPHDWTRLASVYYSVANRALVDALKGRVWRLLRCLQYSNAAMDAADRAYVRTSDCLTLDDLEVIATIWQRYGNPFSDYLRKQRYELLRWAESRVKAGEVCSPHTRAFLQMRAYTFQRRAPTLEEVFMLEVTASQIADAGDFNQAARVNNQIAVLLPRRDVRRVRLQQEAIILAKRGGSADQLAKLGA